MRAIAIEEFGGRDKLQLMDLPIPALGPQDVLIRIKAAGVNPVDWKIREGFLRDVFPHEFPIILGWDASGVVEEIGHEVSRLRVGDDVFAYCRLPVVHNGSYAEYLALPADIVTKKPERLSFEQAASIPLAALTAYQSLFDAGKLQSGETALIHAAAGGVGGFAVQLAKQRGATVIGTASPRNHDYVRDLGADRVIDYATQDFRQEIRQWYPSGVDLVLDCVGGETLDRSVEVLKPAGRVITIVEPAQAETMKTQGIDMQFVFVAPHSGQLQELASLADQGLLKTHVSETFPLEDAARAHEIIESHHVRGKLALTL